MIRLTKGLLVMATTILTLTTHGHAQCDGVADVIFVLGASPALGKVSFQQQKNFLSDVSRSFPVDQNKFRVGAVKYTNKGVAVFYLRLYKKNLPLANRLKSIVLLPKTPRILPDQGLNLIPKLSMFEPKKGGRVYAPRIVILLLDGTAENLPATVDAANALKKGGIKVLVVGIGAVPLVTLQRIASTDKDYFVAKSYADLENLKAKLTQRTCRIPKEFSESSGEKCNALVDVVFALDTSGSIAPADFRKELSFADNIAKSFDIGANSARFSALLFSTSVKLLFNLKTYTSQAGVTQALQAAPYLAGGTATAKALNFIRVRQLFSVANGGRPNAKDVVIVVTDGKSNNMRATVNMADRLKATGVKIVAVGIGQANLQELRFIASSAELVFTAKDFDDLAVINRAVLRGACEASQPEENEQPDEQNEVKPTVPASFDEFDYEDEDNSVTVKPPPATTKGPAPNPAPKPCPALADIVFVIDSSGSLGPDKYNKEKKFTIDIAKRFPIGPSGARFGCVVFSSTAESMFDLSDDLDRASLEEALEALPFLNSTTHTYKAFDLVSEADMFAEDNGGRNKAAKIIIFLTDGLSDNTAKTAEAAQVLKDQGISIISVGIGQYSLAELKAVASDDKNVFTAASFAAIEKITLEVAARACQVPSEGRVYQVPDDNEE